MKLEEVENLINSIHNFAESLGGSERERFIASAEALLRPWIFPESTIDEPIAFDIDLTQVEDLS